MPLTAEFKFVLAVTNPPVTVCGAVDPYDGDQRNPGPPLFAVIETVTIGKVTNPRGALIVNSVDDVADPLFKSVTCADQ